MKQSVSTVIFLSPGTELTPIVSLKYPKFELPILNEPLFLHNLKWVKEISNEIFVIFLSKYKKKINQIIKEFEFKGLITLIEKDQFDGSFFSLKEILKNIQSQNILITKGDIITSLKLEYIFDDFFSKKTDVFLVLKKDVSNTSTVGYNKKGEVTFYTDEPNFKLPSYYFMTNKRSTITRELDLAQVYIFKKKFISNIEGEYFSLKSNLIPFLVNELKQKEPIRFFFAEKEFVQVQKYQDYLRALLLIKEKAQNLPIYLHSSEIEEQDESKKENIFKNYNKQSKNFIYKTKKRITFSNDKNIVGQYTQIEKCNLKKTILGSNCKISNGCLLDDCIVLNNVILGENCRLQRTFIGHNVILQKDTVLVDCKVMNDFIAEEELHATNKTFFKDVDPDFDDDQDKFNDDSGDKRSVKCDGSS
ncbi:Translation initiation factor 2B, gamma subunit (eIF-2Bgamma/GCD1) [Pseudoloma neurophilia]|uniref:Translation initiation factor eIF2B subunit gamma n=1 Tax=Pseudoloma neurophilia TaxID=146866 RepID=A0A0R0M1D9_9MICR|nr:Translation initiation factor 2B, gamma subunit (eIF-2Bgamma/GCD1) [Pseudoloma neurophilia]